MKSKARFTKMGKNPGQAGEQTVPGLGTIMQQDDRAGDSIFFYGPKTGLPTTLWIKIAWDYIHHDNPETLPEPMSLKGSKSPIGRPEQTRFDTGILSDGLPPLQNVSQESLVASLIGVEMALAMVSDGMPLVDDGMSKPRILPNLLSQQEKCRPGLMGT